MKRLPLHLAATAVLLISVALDGCVPEETDIAGPANPVPSLSMSSAESRDELLNRALDVYSGYNATSVQIFGDYSVDASLLSPYATDSEVDATRAFQDSLESRGRRWIGATTVRNATLQSFDPASGIAVVLLCEELDGLRIIDPSGVDITPTGRAAESSRQVTFHTVDESLRVNEVRVWDGSSMCS